MLDLGTHLFARVLCASKARAAEVIVLPLRASSCLSLKVISAVSSLGMEHDFSGMSFPLLIR